MKARTITQQTRDETLRFVQYLPPALREQVAKEISTITYEDVISVLKAFSVDDAGNIDEHSFRAAIDRKLGLLSLLEDELCKVPNIGEKRALETVAKLERDLLLRWADFCHKVMTHPEDLLYRRTTRLVEVKASSPTISRTFHWPETSAQPLMNRKSVKSLRTWVNSFYPEEFP